MPHANSTTSSPRWISPLESAMVLPCSEDKSWARLSNSFCTSSRNLNRTRARRCGLVVAQAGCAASALAMACSTSDFLAKLTLACTSPVLGLNTSPLRPDVPTTFLPPMKWPISRVRASLRTLGSRWRALFPVSDSAACPAREAGEVDHKWISRQLRQSADMSHQASASLASLVGMVDGRKKLHAELHVVPSLFVPLAWKCRPAMIWDVAHYRAVELTVNRTESTSAQTRTVAIDSVWTSSRVQTH